MQQVFAFGAFIPCLVKRKHFVCNRDFPQTVFRLAGNHIEVLFFQMDIFLFQIQELRDAAAIVDQHQHALIERVLCQLPQPLDLGFGKLVPVTLVRILVLVPDNIHKLGIVLVADVILHGIVIQLTEQALQLLQGGIVLPAGVYHKL